MLRTAFALALALAGVAAAAHAQDYPSRPVRVVVPFPPGGGADLHARLLAERLGKLWNQQALIDNADAERSGLNGFESTLGYGLLLPAGTTPALVAIQNRDANKVLQDPVFKKQMQDQGIYLQGGTPEQFKAFLANKRKKWGDLLKRLNIKAS